MPKNNQQLPESKSYQKKQTQQSSQSYKLVLPTNIGFASENQYMLSIYKHSRATEKKCRKLEKQLEKIKSLIQNRKQKIINPNKHKKKKPQKKDQLSSGQQGETYGLKPVKKRKMKNVMVSQIGSRIQQTQKQQKVQSEYFRIANQILTANNTRKRIRTYEQSPEPSSQQSYEFFHKNPYRRIKETSGRVKSRCISVETRDGYLRQIGRFRNPINQYQEYQVGIKNPQMKSICSIELRIDDGHIGSKKDSEVIIENMNERIKNNSKSNSIYSKGSNTKMKSIRCKSYNGLIVLGKNKKVG